VIKTVLAKAEIHTDAALKVEQYMLAGTLYVEKSSNQAEAVKAFENVLQLDPENADALARLREMYEKRRDWESLVRIRRIEAESFGDSDRMFAYAEMAQLATEKIRKPEICIELWGEVLKYDPEHPEALAQLSVLYERSKEWALLADVFEKQLLLATDASQELPVLQKLGGIYADKLNDDDGALRVFRRVLELDPNERRAQEQMKKRLTALRLWDELEAFYASTDKWDEFLRTIEREAENKEASTEERIALYFRVALVWLTQKGKADRSAKAYEKVLELDDTNLEAAIALTPIYEQANDGKKLVGVLEIRLAHASEPEEELALLRDLGTLYETKLRDVSTAFERYLRAFQLAPFDGAVSENVLRVAKAVTGWDRLVKTFEAAIEAASTEDEVVALRSRLGGVLRSIEQIDAALAQYRAVYELRDDDEEAIAALEELLRARGLFDELLVILRRRAELAALDDDRRLLEYAAAALLENELGRRAEAIDAYEQIVALYGDDESTAFEALERLFEAEERFEDLAANLERRIDLGPASEAELSALKFRLARTFETKLSDVSRAIDLYREVLALSPEHEGARVALESLLANEEFGGIAAETLEPIYEVRGDWESLIRALHVLAERADSPDTKRAFLVKIGDVCLTQIGDGGRAFDAYSHALRVLPENEETLAQLEAVAASENRFADLVKILGELAESSSDPALARNLFWRAASVQDAQLGNVDGAIATFQKLLSSQPSDVEALLALEELYRRSERFAEVVPVLRQRIEVAESVEEQTSLLSAIAALYEEKLNDAAASVAVHREILAVDASNASALLALDVLLGKLGRFEELADNVETRLSYAESDEEQLALMMQLGEIREHRLSLAESAIRTYSEVLERDPAHEGALLALERLVAVDAHEATVAEILERHYSAQGEIEKLIGILERQARRAASPEERIELLHRIAELAETGLGDYGRAFGAYARALDEDAASESSLQNLERVSIASGDFARYAAALDARAATVEDPALVAGLSLRAAFVHEDQLGDAAGAISRFTNVLAVDPSNIEAATSLERLFHATEQYGALAGVCLVKARLLDALDEKKDYFFRAAALYEEVLERPLDAVAVYREVLTNEEEDLASLDKLVELFLKLQNWNELLGVYQRRLEVVSDPDDKKNVLVQIGAVYEQEIKDVEKAIAAYKNILEIDPDDVTALERLDALYLATENWTEQLAVIEHQSELAIETTERLGFQYRAAALFEGPLADAVRAVDEYRAILEVDASFEPAIEALERMVAASKEPLAAAIVLEPVYRGMGEAARLVAVLEVQARLEADAARRVELLHQIAETKEGALDDKAGAFDAFARALPLESGNETTQSNLERLAAESGRWASVATLYDRELELLLESEPSRAVELGTRVAQIYEGEIGDVESAIVRYRKVSSADDTHVSTLESLDRLLEATDKWEELVAVLRREALLAESPDDALALQFRQGQVLETKLGRLSDAIGQYREILGAAPEYVPAREALESLFARRVDTLAIAEILESLYRMGEEWDALIGVHVVQLASLTDEGERVAMMLRIADLAEERAGNAALAFEWFQRVLLEVPGNEQSLGEAQRLAELLGEWDQLAGTLAEVVGNVKHDASLRTSLALLQANVFEERLGDVEKAEEAYRFVLTVDVSNAEALEALDRIYTEQGAWAAVASVLSLRIQGATDDKLELTNLLHRLAKVYEGDLGRVDDAIAAYTRVVTSVDPTHLDSLRALGNLYVGRSDWPSLATTLEREAEAVFGDSARADVLAKLARVQADYLGDAEKAIELWRKVLDLRGEDAEALNALGDIYFARESWRDLVDILEREVAIAEDDSTRIAIYDDLGRTWYEKLERERNAIENWERVLDIDATNSDALFSIANVHRKQGQKRELADTLLRVVDVGAATLDDAGLVLVYLELGALYERDLDDSHAAVDAFRKALDLDPRSTEALDSLERLFFNEERWEEVVDIRERRVAILGDNAAKITELLAVARIWDERVGDADRGTVALQQIIELDAKHVEAFKLLDALHRGALRWNDLIDMHLARFEVTDSTKNRIALLREVARTYEMELDDRDQAFDALQVAWTEDFEDVPTTIELERLAAATQRWNDLLATANSSLQEVSDSRMKIAICLCCARWYGSELKHPEYAIPYYQQLLALDATNLPAARQMVQLYRDTLQWSTLVQVLNRLVELTTDEGERMEALVQLGEVHEQHLDAPDVAQQFYEKALAVTGGARASALETLERVFRVREDWSRLLEVLRRQLAVKDDIRDQIVVRIRVAEAYEQKLEDYERAIEVYREVLEIDDRNIDALRGLAGLYEKRKRPSELFAILEKELDVVDSDMERVSTLLKIGDLHETQFLKPERAAERFEQVLEIDPNNLSAIVALERIYRAMRRYDDLLRTFERHVDATSNRAEKVALFKLIGDLYATDLNDLDRAVDAYSNVLSFDGGDVEALEALTRLHEKRGDASASLDAMEQLAKRVTDPAASVELRFRMGKVLDDQLGDRGSAIDKYESALDVDPSHLPSLEAMRRIHLEGGDYLSASRVIEREVQFQPSARVLAKLYVELGQLYETHLDEHDKAVAAFEAAYAHDQDNEDAALPLAKEYFAREMWEQTLPIAELLTKRANRRPTEEQQLLWYMFGSSAAKLERDDVAQKALGHALTLDPQHRETLSALAEVSYRARDFEKALKLYQMVLVQEQEQGGGDAVTELFFRLGIIKQEQGDRQKAIGFWEKALEQDSLHRPTLEAIVQASVATGVFAKAIEYKRRLLDIADADERFALLEQVGDLYAEKLSDPTSAIESYIDATHVNDKNHVILHKLLGLYQQTKQWTSAVDIIDRIKGHDTRPSVQSKYEYTVGVILRDELQDPAAAIERFDRALDLDATQLKPFEAINRVYTQQKDWRSLERAFRKMLHRIQGSDNTDLVWNLWHNLGVIYRDRLQKFESAAEAFRMASQLRPDDLDEHQILAELFGLIPGRVTDAIAEHQLILRRDPQRTDSYRALYKLYFDSRDYDKAWCVAATLSFLKKADQEQQSFYEQYRVRGMIRPTSHLSKEAWLRSLFHPEEDRYVGKVFEAIWPAIYRMRAPSDKAAGLNKKFIEDPATSTVTFAKTFGFIAQMLGFPSAPRLFLLKDRPGGLLYAAGDTPATVSGASLLSGPLPQDLAFLIGHHLSYYRNEHYITQLLKTRDELKVALLAAVRIAGLAPASEPNIETSAQSIAQSLDPRALEDLKAACKLWNDNGARADLKQWLQGVELTACRTGLLACGDLEVAGRIVRDLPSAGAHDLPPGDKLKDLILFSVSEEYFALRQAIGTTIKIA
jgi:tetratricopeptide (TPR) repeat protein